MVGVQELEGGTLQDYEGVVDVEYEVAKYGLVGFVNSAWRMAMTPPPPMSWRSWQ